MRTVLAVTLASAAAIAGAAAQQPQPPTFKAGKTLRLVDVAVTDKHGQFVADLDPADFDLRADRRSVPVEAFYRIVNSRVFGPASTGAASLDLRSPYAPVRTFILFFDTGHIGLAPLARAKSAAQTFLRHELRSTDYAGIVVDGTLVKSRLFTAPEDAAEAVASIRPDPDALAQMIAPARAASGTESAPRSRADEAEAEINAALTQADQSVGEGGIGWEKEKSLAHLLAVVNGMHALPGRKVVVFFSNGFPVGGFMPGDTSGTGHLTLKMIIAAADAAGVRIYTVDPRGLDQGFASSRIISAEAPRPLGESVKSDELTGTPRMTGDDMLASLALDTGGLWLHNENNLEHALERLSRDNGSYYVLGYDVSTGEPEGHFTVRVKRPRVTVRARRSVASP